MLETLTADSVKAYINKHKGEADPSIVDNGFQFLIDLCGNDLELAMAVIDAALAEEKQYILDLDQVERLVDELRSNHETQINRDDVITILGDNIMLFEDSAITMLGLFCSTKNNVERAIEYLIANKTEDIMITHEDVMAALDELGITEPFSGETE